MSCLTGLKVVDFTQVIAGPLATMLLGDLGADVIKVEPPSGDVQRGIGETTINGESAGFFAVNRNKQSVVADLKTQAGLARVKALVADADIVVENFRPGVADRLGIGYADLATSNRRLIYASISGFGNEGPYRHWSGLDQVVQAFSGIMQLTGMPGTGPVRTGFPLADVVTPLFATIGILGALQARASTGEGQRVDVSMLNSLLFSMTPRQMHYLVNGKEPQPLGNSHAEVVPSNVYKTADGRQLMIVAHTEAFWRRLVESVGDPGLRDDGTLNDKAVRIARRGYIDDRLAEIIGSQPLAHWAALFDGTGVLFSALRTFGEVFADPQVQQEMVWRATHPIHGTYRMIGNPIQFSKDRVELNRPVPGLGEHTHLYE